MLGSLYALIVLEAMSWGICLDRGIQAAVPHPKFEPLAESSAAGVQNIQLLSLFIYFWLGVAGYLLTLPLFCIGLQRLRSSMLYPYLVFRVIFTLATIGLGVIIGIYRDRGQFVDLELFIPPIAIQTILGIFFIFLTVMAVKRIKSLRRVSMKEKEHEMMAHGGGYPSGTLQAQPQQQGAYGSWNPYWSWYYGR